MFADQFARGRTATCAGRPRARQARSSSNEDGERLAGLLENGRHAGDEHAVIVFGNVEEDRRGTSGGSVPPLCATGEPDAAADGAEQGLTDSTAPPSATGGMRCHDPTIAAFERDDRYRRRRRDHAVHPRLRRASRRKGEVRQDRAGERLLEEDRAAPGFVASLAPSTRLRRARLQRSIA